MTTNSTASRDAFFAAYAVITTREAARKDYVPLRAHHVEYLCDLAAREAAARAGAGA